MPDQNKIAKTMSAEELQRFCDRLAKSRNVTLETIATLFEEETGVAVSLMGARSFRDSTFARHLSAIRSAAELNAQMKALKADGVSVGEGAELLISQRLMDKLVEFDSTADISEDGGIDALNTLSKITKRLTDSERGNTALRARLAEFERKEAERAEKKRELQEKISKAKASKGGLTKETLDAIQEQLAIL